MRATAFAPLAAAWLLACSGSDTAPSQGAAPATASDAPRVDPAPAVSAAPSGTAAPAMMPRGPDASLVMSCQT
jgi:hypothetical protein